MVYVRQPWLDLTVEEAIEPALPICDPHHHLWDHTGPNERWPGRYLLEDLLRDTSGGHRITQTVFMECGAMYRKGGPPEMRTVGETEFVQGVAAQSASGIYGPTRVAAGIVGHADLMLGEAAAPVLEALLIAGKGRFRGIRNVTVWDADPGIKGRSAYAKGMLMDPKFRQGFALLERYGLSFDSWLFHHQLPELADLAGAFPGITIIVNHIGGPLGIGAYAGKRDEVFRDWKKGVAALAERPNVCIKLGGLGMPNLGFGWNEQPVPPASTRMAEDMRPWFTACIELFGTARCMFESNFPVDKVSCSYTVLWNAFKKMSKGYSASERADLFRDTAARIYRLPAEEQE